MEIKSNNPERLNSNFPVTTPQHQSRTAHLHNNISSARLVKEAS